MRKYYILTEDTILQHGPAYEQWLQMCLWDIYSNFDMDLNTRLNILFADNKTGSVLCDEYF